MPQLKKSDLKFDYEWTASAGDNPKLIEEDGHHLSRKEGYEMLHYLNKLGSSNGKYVYGSGSDLSIEQRLVIEWMIKTYLKSTSPGRGTVTKWVNDNSAALLK